MSFINCYSQDTTSMSAAEDDDVLYKLKLIPILTSFSHG